MIPAPPDRTLRYWLGLVMCEKREAAAIKRRHIAEHVDVDQVTIKRFEEGQRETTGVDQVLAAYAALLGEEDPRTYYADAVSRWRRDGEPPRIETDPTARSRSTSAAARDTRRRPRG